MTINTIILILLAVIAGFGIVFLAHYFVYFSLEKLFQIESSQLKYVIAVVLFILAISFIISTFLAYEYENWATRTLYFISSLWLGVITNLIIGFAVAWILIKILNSANLHPPFILLGVLALLFGFAYSAFGLWNAYRPQIKHVNVAIKNLPPEWKGKTVVQISDVHLGLVLGQNFLANIVNKVNQLNPQAVFITGDLLDGMDFNLDVSLKPLDSIIAPAGTYFITGNHETYLGVQKTFDLISKTKVNILNDQMAVKDGLQIVGISFPERGRKKNLKQAITGISEFDSAKPSILLYHSPTQIQAAKAAGVNLMLSGHTHKGQIFPFNWITKLVYRRYDYGLKQEGDFSIYTSCGVGAWGPTMRTGNKPEIVAITLN